MPVDRIPVDVDVEEEDVPLEVDNPDYRDENEELIYGNGFSLPDDVLHDWAAGYMDRLRLPPLPPSPAEPGADDALEALDYWYPHESDDDGDWPYETTDTIDERIDHAIMEDYAEEESRLVRELLGQDLWLRELDAVLTDFGAFLHRRIAGGLEPLVPAVLEEQLLDLILLPPFRNTARLVSWFWSPLFLWEPGPLLPVLFLYNYPRSEQRGEICVFCIRQFMAAVEEEVAWYGL